MLQGWIFMLYRFHKIWKKDILYLIMIYLNQSKIISPIIFLSMTWVMSILYLTTETQRDTWNSDPNFFSLTYRAKLFLRKWRSPHISLINIMISFKDRAFGFKRISFVWTRITVLFSVWASFEYIFFSFGRIIIFFSFFLIMLF